MPYVTKNNPSRCEIEVIAEAAALLINGASEYDRTHGGKGDDSGWINFTITKMLVEYMKINGGVSYSTINKLLGALEGVKLELYRRVASEYEDKKCSENGDVY